MCARFIVTRPSNRPSSASNSFKAKTRKRLFKWLPWMMLLLGVGVISFALVTRLSVSGEQQRLVNEYIEQGMPAGVSIPQTTISDVIPDPDTPNDLSAGVLEPTTLAILLIPTIDLEVAVREGLSSSALKYSVAHYPGTALPGEAGNCALLGHRNYTFGEFFNRLDELSAGDEVMLLRAGHVYTYRVTEAFVVEPSETYVLDPTPEAAVTLITCTPIRSATHRLIVRGVLAGSELV